MIVIFSKVLIGSWSQPVRQNSERIVRRNRCHIFRSCSWRYYIGNLVVYLLSIAENFWCIIRCNWGLINDFLFVTIIFIGLLHHHGKYMKNNRNHEILQSLKSILITHHFFTWRWWCWLRISQSRLVFRTRYSSQDGQHHCENNQLKCRGKIWL